MNFSILIPNFNGDVVRLVRDLFDQANLSGSEFEILVGDDASDLTVYKSNRQVEELGNVRILRVETRKGRAAMRNYLARNAKHDWLLFIDADAQLRNPEFIDNYLKALNESDVLVGGTAYQSTIPDNPAQILRWRYGRKVEERSYIQRNKNPYGSFSAFNFFIRKTVFDKLSFNEDMYEYGHEDTVFGMHLMAAGIPLVHIDNPLIHGGLEDALSFIAKTRSSLDNLYRLSGKIIEPALLFQQIRLIRWFRKIHKMRLAGPVRWVYTKTFKALEKKLLGPNPSIGLFQFYKLGYYTSLHRAVKTSNSRTQVPNKSQNSNPKCRPGGNSRSTDI